MKYVQVIFLISSLWVGQLFAQQETSHPIYFALYGHVGFPLGEYHNTVGDKAGYAKSGLGFTAEIVKKLKKRLSWLASITYLNNSFDIGTLNEQLSDVEGLHVRADSYRSYWFLTGFKIEEQISSKLTLYSVGKLGLVNSKYPTITFTWYDPRVNRTYTQKLKTVSFKAFAMEFGWGVLFKKMTFGFSYSYAQPKYEHYTTVSGETNRLQHTLPLSIVRFTIGFNFTIPHLFK